MRLKPTEAISMEYDAIIKDGGLFIPNILTDIDVSQVSVLKVTLDLQVLRKQVKNTSAIKPIQTPSAKVSLGSLPIRAFDDIQDPVEWQNSLREEW